MIQILVLLSISGNEEFLSSECSLTLILRQEVRCGTTALVTLIRVRISQHVVTTFVVNVVVIPLQGNDDMAVGSVGDSRALLVGPDSLEWLSTPHLPSLQTEKTRIYRCASLYLSILSIQYLRLSIFTAAYFSLDLSVLIYLFICFFFLLLFYPWNLHEGIPTLCYQFIMIYQFFGSPSQLL